MLVYDAGTLLPQGKYARGGSRLSDLAGVTYALYDQLHDNTIRWASIAGNSGTARQMEIPPGKYYPFEKDASSPGSEGGFEVQLRRYKFGELTYPSFVTSGGYAGEVLFHSQAGVVAGRHAYDKGSVLFVNLPLGYLKANTDGLLLHAFLNYFAKRSLFLPYLMSVPDGVGGLVLNWHVDSNAAIKPIEEISSWALLKQGPYSVHVTAGPDVLRPGDGKGFNVLHNRIGQELLRQYEKLGYQVGSHGGWMHNYFAAHIDKDNPADLEKYLVWNAEALEQVTGRRVTEYSAPEGNQPAWVTHWLENMVSSLITSRETPAWGRRRDIETEFARGRRSGRFRSFTLTKPRLSKRWVPTGIQNQKSNAGSTRLLTLP